MLQRKQMVLVARGVGCGILRGLVGGVVSRAAGGTGFAASALSLLAASGAAAGVTVRFTGGYSESIATTVINSKSFDRSDPNGEGNVQFDEFPPMAYASKHMRATASAGPGYLSASSHAELITPQANGGNFEDELVGSTFCSVRFDDLVISGPAGTPTVSFNVHLHGSQIYGASANASCSTTVSVAFAAKGVSVGGGMRTISEHLGNTTTNESGVFTGFTGGGVVVSQAFTVMANVPLTLEMDLQTFSNAVVNFNFISDAVANTDFANTVSFATDRPVFNLPAGYTANSAQAGIVNNQFTRQCPGDLNRDNVVDDADFSIFVGAYNILDCADPEMPAGCPADLNKDGVVDDSDFTIFVVRYNDLVCP